MGEIKLGNGKILVNRFGKYEPDLSFIFSEEDRQWFDWFSPYSDIVKQAGIDFNVEWDGSPDYMFGHYWVSKKGTSCFAPTAPEKATHILVGLDWGGPHNYGGCHGYGSTELQKAVYDRNACSNGGGAGIRYYICPADNYANEYSEEDI